MISNCLAAGSLRQISSLIVLASESKQFITFPDTLVTITDPKKWTLTRDLGTRPIIPISPQPGYLDGEAFHADERLVIPPYFHLWRMPLRSSPQHLLNYTTKAGHESGSYDPHSPRRWK